MDVPQTGFQHFQPFMTFRDAEDTGLLWMYALYSPPRPKKLTRNEKLLNTRLLIVILLIVGGIECHPGEFYGYYFFLSNAILFMLKRTKVSQRSLFNFEHCAVRKSVSETQIEITQCHFRIKMV